MVAIHNSSKSRSTKIKRIRILLILALLLCFVALLVGFVLRNLHLSIVKQHQDFQTSTKARNAHLHARLGQPEAAVPAGVGEDDDDAAEEEENFAQEQVENEDRNNAWDDDEGGAVAGNSGDDEMGDDAAVEEGDDQQSGDDQGNQGDDVNGGDDANGPEEEQPPGDDDGMMMKQEEEEQGTADAVCPYGSLSKLTDIERYPVADGERHMADPPKGGRVSLACCMTTVGPWNFVIRHAWAPKGAERVQSMVESGYFGNQKVPLMRCIHNFLCQFGLAGPASKEFDTRLPDDPNWLPEGPTHKENEQGVKRFATGYMAYAGAGPNSRGVQLIVALHPNGPLAGGSPWEVPWGETVGEHSFETLSQIYTGYGDNGPSQGLLRREGASENVAEQFPELDYILSCQIVDEEVQDAGGDATATA